MSTENKRFEFQNPRTELNFHCGRFFRSNYFFVYQTSILERPQAPQDVKIKRSTLLLILMDVPITAKFSETWHTNDNPSAPRDSGVFLQRHTTGCGSVTGTNLRENNLYVRSLLAWLDGWVIFNFSRVHYQ